MHCDRPNEDDLHDMVLCMDGYVDGWMDGWIGHDSGINVD